MSDFSVDSSTGFDSRNLFIANLGNAQNVRFEGLVTSTGNPILGEYKQTFSSLVFESGGLTYSYNGTWTQTDNRLVAIGTTAASGNFDSVTVSNSSGQLASYDGLSFDVDFGSSTDIPLLDFVGNLLQLLLGQNAQGSGAYANLNTDATPDLVAQAFAGADVLQGGSGADTLYGFAGKDSLNGGLGADTMVGGADSDTYRVDNAGDIIVEGKDEGSADVVLSSVNYTLGKGVYVEFLQTNSTAGTAAINLTGNELSQTIIGNAGANTLTDGGGAGDVLKGLGGNDIYRIASAATTIVEGKDGGTADVVLSSVDYTLGKGVYVEFLQTNSTAGTAAINLTGNELSQTIIGNAGINNLSDGGGSGDILKGLGGNDIYRVASAATTIVEGATEGTTDVVLASVSFKLNAGAHVEYLQTGSTLGTSNIDLTGNEFAQSVIGNAGANRLDGKGGADVLTGHAGADTFVFSTAPDLGVDRIADFTAVDDTIELSQSIFTALNVGALAPSAFRANSTGLAGDATDRIIYETDTGKLFYDPDGNGAASAVQFAVLTGHPTITNADFIVTV